MVRSAPLPIRALSLVLIGCLVLTSPLPLGAQEPSPPPPAPPAPEPEKGGEKAKPPEEAEPFPEPADEEPAPTEEAEAPARAGASLRGRIFHSDRRTPWPTAAVYAIAPDGSVRSAPPADEKGRYLLSGLPPGNYRLAVLTGEGVFSLESPVGITSAHDFTVNLALVPAEAASGDIPGVAASPRGFAFILQGGRKSGTTFWRGPKGITLLVLTGAAAALILSEANDQKEKPVSPSAP